MFVANRYPCTPSVGTATACVRAVFVMENRLNIRDASGHMSMPDYSKVCALLSGTGRFASLSEHSPWTTSCICGCVVWATHYPHVGVEHACVVGASGAAGCARRPDAVGQNWPTCHAADGLLGTYALRDATRASVIREYSWARQFVRSQPDPAVPDGFSADSAQPAWVPASINWSTERCTAATRCERNHLNTGPHRF